jgi:hypothetical protein
MKCASGDSLRACSSSSSVFLVLLGAEIHHRRKVLSPDETPQHVNAVTIAVKTAEQDEVVTGA